ncbi:helix-turn-helix domain-containing protein [Leclercia sp.]|jgi:transcriptional regulator with XRE-family HTH domain|uniref:helix-turn-helix domain-containing protein n=1 Tax=Leclercia sp. TaxID=1898428 RepID=UPI0039183637
MNTGKAIKIALVIKGVSQKELSEALGMSAPAVSQLCKRESASISMLTRVSSFLGMTVSELIALGE